MAKQVMKLKCELVKPLVWLMGLGLPGKLVVYAVIRALPIKAWMRVSIKG